MFREKMRLIELRADHYDPYHLVLNLARFA